MFDFVKVIEKEIQLVEEFYIVVEEKYRINKISVEECKWLVEKLEIVMYREKFYINFNLKIVDLVVFIGILFYILFYLFNQYLNCNYYDYINDYCMVEFKCLVEKDEYVKYILSVLVELCGFSLRVFFF